MKTLDKKQISDFILKKDAGSVNEIRLESFNGRSSFTHEQGVEFVPRLASRAFQVSCTEFSAAAPSKTLKFDFYRCNATEGTLFSM